MAKGNTRVVSSRLADARFFVAEDTRTPLADKVPQLQNRLYMQGLAEPTLRDKVARLEQLSLAFAELACPAEMATVQRAAFLCKADLSTKVVFEFPELQGFIGADYARRDGEPSCVVTAIAEHYQPRFAGDAIPSTVPGQLLALADKLDAIAACFALGLVPSGTQDPYALRRAALGALRILAENDVALRLHFVTEQAVRAVLPAAAFDASGEPIVADILGFFRTRLVSQHTQEFPTDLVEAVLDAGFDDLRTVLPRLRALDTLRQGDGFAPLAAAFKRIANIVRKNGAEPPAGLAIQPALFVLPAEQHLHDAMQQAGMHVLKAIEKRDYPAACSHLVDIKPAVDGFFDDVMVMADDLAVRHNRLALLRGCASLFAQLADFARIQA